MKRLHAQYPFLDAAREAVEDADVDLVELVQREDTAAVDRAVERVEAALSEGVVGEQHRRPRVELLSYPIARVIVSLVDERVLLRKYAHAEAATARQRFESDLTDDTQLKSTSTQRLSRKQLLAEFDLASDIRSVGDGRYHVAVGPYLRLSGELDGDQWRLASRALRDGTVPIDGAELHDLLQQAIRARVVEGLPLNVPEPIAEGLTDAVEQLESSLADQQLSYDFDAVVPSLFPPCVQNLLGRVESGDELEPEGRFALTAFLTSVGLAPEEAAERSAGEAFGEETTRYQAAHLAGQTSPEYAPPGCATMAAYGLCVDADETCETVDHPITYYDERLDDAPIADVE